MASGDPLGPADTSMMRIVHTALRRDVARTRSVLTDVPYPDPAQRTALCAHLHWMMGFLHHHHEYEDTVLYAHVRQATPDAADLLDEMDVGHKAIHAAMVAVDDAAVRYQFAPEWRQKLLDAIDTLSEVLLPHLHREEQEMMPVLSATLTQRQWRHWDQEYNVKPLALREKAFTGHWLIDDLDPEDEAIVSALIPAVPRWTVKHMLAHRYRKAMYASWRLPQHADRNLSLDPSLSSPRTPHCRLGTS